jgi:hypothetical protein
MIAPGKLTIWTNPAHWPADATHGVQLNRGRVPA